VSATCSLNLDTSVLINYIYSSLPREIERDEGGQRLIDGEDFYTVIGGTVESEFHHRMDRRYELYKDVVEFLRETDESIFEYEPRKRNVNSSERDRSHFLKNIQMGWHDLEKPQQLSLLRRCMQDIELYQMQLVGEVVDESYDKQENAELLRELEAALDIGHDCDVLVDAIEISRQDSVETLVSMDSDLVGSETVELVPDILGRVFNEDVMLEISKPEDVSIDV